MKFTSKAIDEQSLYGLNQIDAYQKAVALEYSICERRMGLYGYWAPRNQATKNMLKALRLMPALNTPEDWARLHVTEAALKAPRIKLSGQLQKY